MLDGRFGQLAALARSAGLGPFDGIVFDLGVSSFQLADPARGFSFQKDGPLDMRMQDTGPSAADLVGACSEAELRRIITRYGEEPSARRIARAIVQARARRPIRRTLELAAIVEAAAPRRPQAIHPATRTFQALRIAVNDELGELERGLAAAVELLAPGGRLVVVAFHSLEDRIVKRFLRGESTARPQGSRHLPPADAPPPRLRLLTRGAQLPGAAEIERNPRARSARLRAAERLAADDEASRPGPEPTAWELAA
jgi:16S rRNA (cytosine1402-N4)-methyltransferase